MISDILTISTKSRLGSAPATDRSLLRDFVIGPENAIVVESIVRPFLDQLEVEFFPICLWGKTGSGKSHLIQTLASFVNREAIIADANAFSSECTEAMKVDEVPAFERRFLQCGYLFFDDIDYLHSKPVAQSRFQKILDLRTRANKVTVITAQRPPLSLKLGAGLISRISEGVVVPLEYPKNKTREQLLRAFADRAGVTLNDDSVHTIVEQNQTAPALLSQILALSAEPSVSGLSTIDPLPNRSEKKPYEAKRIIRTAANYYGLSTKDLCGSSRRKQHVLARSMAMYLLRQNTDLSYQEIGHVFGDRDHTTVMHACRKIESLIKDDALTQATAAEILRKCEAG
ncbi:MAG: AAA family ATPase [Planctomycetales bacterium]|nr:AAA family ATPase [Planctomycetales bacterium]